MILQALTAYYERLKNNPNVEIALPGFATQKVHFALVIDQDGQLKQVRDIRNMAGKKPAPVPMILPTIKRSGKKPPPQFFWDNTGYVLGADNKEKPDRARKAFEAFREFHNKMCAGVTDDAIQAVLKFLAEWQPENAPQLEHWQEMAGLNVVFQLDGDRSYVHDRHIVKELWLKHLATEDTPKAFCLVSGQRAPVARIHPDIKGVDGAQTKGAALVSFNLDAFCSHGKEQNYNAPVSIEAAAAYTAALNYLLRRDNNPQRIKIGDATTVFWTERDSPVEGFFGLVFDAREDTGQNESLRLFLEAARDGKPLPNVDEGMKFYILGLSPNAARLAVRFWHVSTVADIKNNVGRYFRDIAICKSFDNEPDYPTLQQLLRETAPKTTKPQDRKPPALLAGAVVRSILDGLPFPQSLLPIVLDRIRADQGNINYFRACLLAGVLRRNHNQEVSMGLDPNNKDRAYLLGRLFAVLERAQAEAIKKPNATIRDRFYGSASATPCAVFPVLLRLAQHHVAKADYGDFRDREIAAILNDVQEFPKRLGLVEQGQFALGYYHQRQHRTTNKPQEETSNEQTNQ